MKSGDNKAGDGPGVPEGLPRTLQRLSATVGARELDRLWIFPPMVRGRKEWGLVAAGCFAEGGHLRLVTASYSAERTGAGLEVDMRVREEGSAPPDRFPRVMQGVARRSELDLGEARLVEISGNQESFEDLMAEFSEDLLETVEP